MCTTCCAGTLAAFGYVAIFPSVLAYFCLNRGVELIVEDTQGRPDVAVTKLRKLVSAAFTPRQVRRIEDSIKSNAKTIVEELRAAGSGADFVDHCAKELPIRTLSDMVGIPESERQRVAHAADALVSWADPVYLDGRNPLEVLVENQVYLHQVAGMLAAERREHPGDDLFSALVNAEVDGDRLSDADVAAFFVLVAVVGIFLLWANRR